MSSIYVIDHLSNNVDSPIHRASVYSKIILAISFLISILTSSTLHPLLIIMGFTLFLMFLAKLPVATLLKWSLYPIMFSSIFALSQLSYGILPIVSIIKAEDAALTMLLIVTTTPYTRIFSLFQRFSTTLTSVLFLTYRFFFLLIESVETKMKVLRVRGGYSGNLLKKLKNVGMVVGQVFITSIDDVEKVYRILMLRGFKGKIYTLKEERFRKEDLLLIFISLLALGMVIL